MGGGKLPTICRMKVASYFGITLNFFWVHIFVTFAVCRRFPGLPEFKPKIGCRYYDLSTKHFNSMGRASTHAV